MSGWGSWLSSTVTSVAKNVQQFGQECIDTVVSIDEEEEKQALDAASRRQAKARSAETTDQAPSSSETAAPSGETAATKKAPSASGGGTLGKVTNFLFAVDDDDDNETVEATPEGASAPADGGTGSDRTTAGETTVTTTTTTATATAAPPQQRSSEFAFLASQPLQLMALGRMMVERGADVALQLLPDIDSPAGRPPPPQSGAGTSTEADGTNSGARLVNKDDSAASAVAMATTSSSSDGAATAAVPHSPHVDPLDSLRQWRGAIGLHLRERSSAARRETHEAAEQRVAMLADPSAVCGQDYGSSWSELLMTVEHVGQTSAGRRIVFVREDMSNQISDPETGEPLQDAALVAIVDKLPEMARQGALSVADLVLKEIADAVALSLSAKAAEIAGVSERLRAQLRQAAADGDYDWFATRSDAIGNDDDTASSSPACVLPLTLEDRVKRIVDLVTFSQCECARGASALVNVASDAQSWARKTSSPELKTVKDRVLRAKGDVLVARACELPRIEEALECCATLLAAADWPLGDDDVEEDKDARLASSGSKNNNVAPAEVSAPDASLPSDASLQSAPDARQSLSDAGQNTGGAAIAVTEPTEASAAVVVDAPSPLAIDTASATSKGEAEEVEAPAVAGGDGETTAGSAAAAPSCKARGGKGRGRKK